MLQAGKRPPPPTLRRQLKRIAERAKVRIARPDLQGPADSIPADLACTSDHNLRHAGLADPCLQSQCPVQVQLSTSESVTLRLSPPGDGAQPVSAVLTRRQFEKLSAELFRRAREPVDKACWQVGIAAGHRRRNIHAMSLCCVTRPRQSMVRRQCLARHDVPMNGGVL